MSPDLVFGVNASREGLIEKMFLLQPENFIGLDMALSEHEFFTPKRFTVSPCLTITKVRFWGPKPSNLSKIQESFLQWSFFFLMVLGLLEVKLTKKLQKAA